MGEIQPKTCEGRELTKNQLEARTPVFKWAVSDDLITWSEAQPLLTKQQAMNLSSFVRLGMNCTTVMPSRSLTMLAHNLA